MYIRTAFLYKAEAQKGYLVGKQFKIYWDTVPLSSVLHQHVHIDSNSVNLFFLKFVPLAVFLLSKPNLYFITPSSVFKKQYQRPKLCPATVFKHVRMCSARPRVERCKSRPKHYMDKRTGHYYFFSGNGCQSKNQEYKITITLGQQSCLNYLLQCSD